MIFEHKNHFSYLKERLDPRTAKWGSKSKLAEHLRVQPAFLSQVLSRKISMSLEQADLANQFFDHSQEESDFFILLVSRDRAGTASLKKHYDQQIENIVQKRKMLVERLGKKPEISLEARGVYYSNWIYSAIHVACLIPRLRTRKAVAEYLELPAESVGKVLDFLEFNNLLKKDGEGYVSTQSWVRLDNESPHIVTHHSNWRQKSIQSLNHRHEDDLHYSGVFSLDAKTARQIKDEFLDFLKKQVKSMDSAKDEDLFAIGLDMFGIGNR